MFVILDADRDGAVLLDGARRTYRGVRRDAGVVWEDRSAAGTAAMVTCLATCPDAAVSAGIESLSSPAVPDPDPAAWIGGQLRPLAVALAHKRQILTASGPDDYVLATGDPNGGWRLELQGRGRPVTALAVGGFRTSWQESADGTHALAITIVPGAAGNEARWFSRTAGAWRMTGAMSRVTGFLACVAPDGSRAVLLGQRPALLDRAGGVLSVTDLVTGGACALGAGGGLIVELAQTGEGTSRSRVRAVDSTGATRWRRDLAHAADVVADPTGSRVGYLADGVLHVLDATTGTELRTIADVTAARYDAAGDLVVADRSGTVRWLADDGP